MLFVVVSFFLSSLVMGFLSHVHPGMSKSLQASMGAQLPLINGQSVHAHWGTSLQVDLSTSV